MNAPNFVVLTKSGAVWLGPRAWPHAHPMHPGEMHWGYIMAGAGEAHYRDASGDIQEITDQPDRLLVNGETVVASGLADISRAYSAALKAAKDRVYEEFEPDWLKALYAKIPNKQKEDA